jgi:hypothetical protein
MKGIYFFGCYQNLGHYLYEAGRRYHVQNPGLPWTDNELDGGLAPKNRDEQTLGRATLHHRAGWTAMAMWDRSLDQRFNSNAAFIARGEHGFGEMLRLAREGFPDVLARIEAQAPLVEAQ